MMLYAQLPRRDPDAGLRRRDHGAVRVRHHDAEQARGRAVRRPDRGVRQGPRRPGAWRTWCTGSATLVWSVVPLKTSAVAPAAIKAVVGKGSADYAWGTDPRRRQHAVQRLPVPVRGGVDPAPGGGRRRDRGRPPDEGRRGRPPAGGLSHGASCLFEIGYGHFLALGAVLFVIGVARRAHAPQRAHHDDEHRADAQRRQHHRGHVRPHARRPVRPHLRADRHRRRRRRGGGRPRDRGRGVPRETFRRRRSLDLAQALAMNPAVNFAANQQALVHTAEAAKFLGLPVLAWIPLLPLLGALINLTIGRKMSRGFVHFVAVAAVAAAFGVSLFVVIDPLRKLFSNWVGHHDVALPAFKQVAYSWIEVGGFKAELAFRLDTLSAVMIMVVTFVGTLIHVYSTGYMAKDDRPAAYFGYLNLFTGSMLILVLGANLPVMFIGWEGVGLCSFLLIGLLVHERRVRDRRPQGVRREPHRRLLLPARDVPPVLDHEGHLHRERQPGRPAQPRLRSVGVERRPGRLHQGAVVLDHRPDRRRRRDPPVHRRGRQERPDPALRVAARRDGRSDAGLRADPRRHHGHRRRVHGVPDVVPVRVVDDGADRGGDRRRADRARRGVHGVRPDRHIQIDSKTIHYEIKKLDKTKAALDANAEKVHYYAVVFKDLPVGTYSLSLSGEGFKTTNELEVHLQDYSQRVTLSNNDHFLMGDFDQDGTVSQKDYDALLHNMKATDASTIKKFDLNRDGAVTILDLSYVQENLNKTASGATIVETSPIVNTNNMTLDITSSVGIPDDELGTVLENLVTGNESVGVNVTPDQPAQISMSFNKSVKMNRINIAVPNSEQAPTAGYVLIEDESGQVSKVYYGNEAYRNAVGYSAKMNRSVGTIQIDLKNQVAVKKITIVVTETTGKDAQLAEIGKVEFLNNVYEEIPAPEMNIPKITGVEEGAEELTVKWNAEPNVDGYEVKLVGNIKNKEVTKIIQTTKTQVKFESLENYEPYKISIQSLNGEWESGYSAEVEATPKPTGKPEAPEGVSITGVYRGLEVSWSKHKNADTFNLYYKKAGSDEEPKVVENLKQLNYTISGLEDDTEYEIYLTAVNDHGVSEASQIYKGKTIDLVAPITPNYKLINVSNGINQPTEHIKDVAYTHGEYADAFDIVDDDYGSSWIYKSWDGGGFNKGKPSPTVEFDSQQTIDTIVVVPDVSQKHHYGYVKVRVQENGQMVEKPASHQQKTDKNGKLYYEVRLNDPVTTDKVQVNFALGYAHGDGTISISEMKFYHYDSLEDDVRNLFEDDLLVKLKDDVTLEMINDLREKANTVDSVSGEYHPYKDVVLRELDYAEQLYIDSQVDSEIMIVNQGITNTGNNLGMGNDNQALGLSARAGDELTVYVGSNGTLPELVFTQVYGESGKYQKTVKLQKGRNVIQVPKIHDMDVEKGGNIYVRYPSGSATKGDVKVRVMGATKIPHLNLYGLINDESKQDEVKAAIRSYITDLQAYVDELPNLYPTEANPSENEYLYDKKTSVLNTTDIELDKATFNVAATAILEGLESSTSLDDKVEQLYDSLKAMEQLMDLKYAERGVSENPDFDGNGKIEGDELKHLYPKSRANIKYQRMFIGAFMYAGSNHVGIEYNSIAGLTSGKPFTFNDRWYGKRVRSVIRLGYCT